jgi:hypothetical protein
MQMMLKKAATIVLLLGSSLAQSQVAQPSATEIEKRNAAVSFVLVREGSLYTLLGECSHLMALSNLTVEAIAKGWFDRNKPELEAAYVWLDQYMLYLKTNDPAKFQLASTELASVQGNSILQNARVFFGRQVPNLVSCERAAKTYSISQTDFKNMALNPGYEQFAEFPETLARIRAVPNFSVPQHLKFGFDSAKQNLVGVGNIASLDAAEAARERGDGPGRVAVFKGLAERGDGMAAQQIGLMYLNGQQVQKNAVEAYRWFYAAWSLSEMEGLNALGVMNRDGLGVPVNLLLAQSAFYLAKAGARSQPAFDRALNNSDRLADQISPEAKTQMSCTSLTSIDAELKRPIQSLQPFVKPRGITSPERRLGAIVKDLAAIYQAGACR